MLDASKIAAAKEALSEVRKANMNLRGAIAKLSLGELAEIVCEMTVSKPVVINVDVGVSNEKGKLVILKPSEKVDLGIVMWSTPSMTTTPGLVAQNSICVDFMKYKVFFEVFSGAEDKHMYNNFACIALACKKNKIRSVFLLQSGNMSCFFGNTGNYDIAVVGISDFLEEASLYLDKSSLELSFLDLHKSSALDFHEYRDRCEIRDYLEV